MPIFCSPEYEQLLPCSTEMSSQESLLQSIAHTNRQMMALIDDLDDEQLDVPYEQGINPPIWEVGHSAFFYEFFLLRSLSPIFLQTRGPG